MTRSLLGTAVFLLAGLFTAGQAVAEDRDPALTEPESFGTEIIEPTSMADQLDFEQIRQLEALLVSRGYEVGDVDGIIAFETREALREFQLDNGLPQTGEPTAATIRALATTPEQQEYFGLSPEFGYEGEAAPLDTDSVNMAEPLDRNQVRQLQRLLEERGYEVGAIDGIIGVQTRTALREFQQEHGLRGDGVPTEATLRELATTPEQQEYFGLSPEFGETSDPAGTKADMEMDADSEAVNMAEQLDRNQIQELQRLLENRGYNVGAIDGVIGMQTRMALREFQVVNGLPANGVPTEETLRALATTPEQQEFFGLSPEFGEEELFEEEAEPWKEGESDRY